MSSHRADSHPGEGTHVADTTRRRRMRVPCFVALAIASALLPSACGEPADSAALEDEGTAPSALDATCAWDPDFGVNGCLQSDWWMEFSVHDTTAASMQVEVAGATGSRFVTLPGRVPFGAGHVKFTGGAGSPVPAGTPVRLHATQYATAGGKTADSLWFGYRAETPAVDCEECTPFCAPDTCGSDGCGGTCACPTGDVCLSDLTCCTPNSNPCGPDGCGGSHGECACVPDCDDRQCGDDGCGGSCGTCEEGTTCTGGTCAGGCVPDWSPFWQQTSSAGSWWAEFQVVGGGSLARSVALEVVGKKTFPLSYAYGRWAGGLNGVPSGSPAVLHATDATGATAHTMPFSYLVDKAPVTDPCLGTPSTSADCLPLDRGMVTITMDDSYASQAVLAAPVLATYGVEATTYQITRQLQTYGLLPSAQALAAAGHEIGSHTQTHPYLPNLEPRSLDDELRYSQRYLLSYVGSPVDSFASPMGAYNAAVLDVVKLFYTSHRTVNPGLNYAGSKVYELNADGVYNTTSPATVCEGLTKTALYRGWRILVFHDFTSAATASSSLTYPIADFASILQCAQDTPGLDVVTTRQGAARIACASP